MTKSYCSRAVPIRPASAARRVSCGDGSGWVLDGGDEVIDSMADPSGISGRGRSLRRGRTGARGRAGRGADAVTGDDGDVLGDTADEVVALSKFCGKHLAQCGSDQVHGA